MSERKLRRHRRIPYSGPVRISWEDRNGLAKYAQGKCLDLSESGLRIETSHSIPVRALVAFNADRLNLAGSATVKHVLRLGPKYVLGLELTHPLRDKTLALAVEPQACPNPANVA